MQRLWHTVVTVRKRNDLFDSVWYNSRNVRNFVKTLINEQPDDLIYCVPIIMLYILVGKYNLDLNDHGYTLLSNFS
jgi:hypothetical protein